MGRRHTLKLQLRRSPLCGEIQRLSDLPIKTYRLTPPQITPCLSSSGEIHPWREVCQGPDRAAYRGQVESLQRHLSKLCGPASRQESAGTAPNGSVLRTDGQPGPRRALRHHARFVPPDDGHGSTLDEWPPTAIRSDFDCVSRLTSAISLRDGCFLERSSHPGLVSKRPNLQSTGPVQWVAGSIFRPLDSSTIRLTSPRHTPILADSRPISTSGRRPTRPIRT